MHVGYWELVNAVHTQACFKF